MKRTSPQRGPRYSLPPSGWSQALWVAPLLRGFGSLAAIVTFLLMFMAVCHAICGQGGATVGKGHRAPIRQTARHSRPGSVSHRARSWMR